ncbi:MAG TPA: hypothetical protein PL066_02935 [bacterium]|nr:hypothetical protein [bacterium]
MDLNTNPQEQIPVPKPEQLAVNVNTGVYEAPAPATHPADSTPHTVAEAEAAIAAIEEPKTQEQMFAEHLYKIAKLDGVYSNLQDDQKERFMEEFHKKMIKDFYYGQLDQKKNDKELADDLYEFFKLFPYNVGVDGQKSEISSYFLKQEAGNAVASIFEALRKN